MRSIILVIAVLFASATVCRSQECVIIGGTGLGTMTQHCTIDLNPPPISLLMNAFQVKEAKNGRVEHRILARIPSVADLVLTACGDGVLDVNALPWPSGMVPRGKTKRTGNCMEKYFDNLAAGKWVLSVTTAKADTQFTLKPVLQ